MKFLFYSICVLIFASHANGAKKTCSFNKKHIYSCQGQLVQFDPQHLYRVGLYIKKFSNGKVEQKGRYRYERRDGEWKTFYSNGKLKDQSYYFYGIHYGTVTEYTNGGQVKRRFSYPDKKTIEKYQIKDSELEKKLEQLLIAHFKIHSQMASDIKTLLVLRYKQYADVSYLLKLNDKLQFKNIKFALDGDTWRLEE